MNGSEQGHTRRQRRSSLSQQLQRVFHLDKHVNKETCRRSSEPKTNDSTGPHPRNIENNSSHEQGPEQVHLVTIDSNARRVESRAPSPPVSADLDRLSFAATLNLKNRESGTVKLSGHRRSLRVSSPELTNNRGKHTRGSHKSTRRAQAAADAGKSLKSSPGPSSTNLQAKPLRTAPSRTSTDRYPQRQYKSYVSSPLAVASTVASRSNLSSNAMDSSDTRALQPSIEDDQAPMDSVKKVIDPTYKQTHSHVTRHLVGRDGNEGEGDHARPHSVAKNPRERSVVGYTWASHRLQSPLGKRILTNQHEAHAVTCREPGPIEPVKKSYSRIHDTIRSLTDSDVHEAKHAGPDEHRESQGPPPRDKTQACQDRAQSFQDTPNLQRLEVYHVSYERKPTQWKGSSSSISASSEEPRSEDYNTADEAHSSTSLPRQDDIAPASLPHNDDSVPSTLGITNNDVLLSVGASNTGICNTPKGRMNGRMEQLRNVQTDSPFKMLFVICCHCSHWHDLPSELNLSNASSTSSLPESNQELESMYDYLAKVILLGPSGAGKSCVLHRFVKSEWRVLSSQTIGVEFSSKIVKLGAGPRRTRIKLQLWDTAGTERFRSVSRSYYRGAAGAILIYDITSHASFVSLPTFLMDARALASPNLSVLLAGNKSDLASDSVPPCDSLEDNARSPPTPSSTSSRMSFPFGSSGGSVRSNYDTTTRMTATHALHGREVSTEETSHWAAKSNIPVAVEVSALTGEGVEELFNRLARIILTKIELGEIDPDDPQSGIQYGDGALYGHGTSDGSSIRSRISLDDGAVQLHRRQPRKNTTNNWKTGMREWEDVFRLSDPHQRRGSGCC
ncbi:hypothetical protein CBS147343_3193 [Aspergillus niger]|nr:hypothetical protein CBS12448_3480 [Aspergillus niger]KAI2921935.1 hypothetical protein CBS147371_2428 [Aspergillus niger]KAI2939984.1 hypothetical protein CBS147321_6491 [Aspergillus niger]KAI2959500.1 hypothetical protein CBS147322_1212 [Aspergillus niger]KAI2970100.1 hypothetical protein CBS147324_5607 [Aspergillus niger]